MKDRTWAKIFMVIAALAILTGGWNTYVAHNTANILHKERNMTRTINITEIVYKTPIINACLPQLFQHPTCRQTVNDYDRYTMVSKECYYKDSVYVQRTIFETRNTLIDDLEFQSILEGLDYWYYLDPLYSKDGFKIMYVKNSMQRMGSDEVVLSLKGNKPAWFIPINWTKPEGDD